MAVDQLRFDIIIGSKDFDTTNAKVAKSITLMDDLGNATQYAVNKMAELAARDIKVDVTGNVTQASYKKQVGDQELAAARLRQQIENAILDRKEVDRAAAAKQQAASDVSGNKFAVETERKQARDLRKEAADLRDLAKVVAAENATEKDAAKQKMVDGALLLAKQKESAAIRLETSAKEKADNQAYLNSRSAALRDELRLKQSAQQRSTEQVAAAQRELAQNIAITSEVKRQLDLKRQSSGPDTLIKDTKRGGLSPELTNTQALNAELSDTARINAIVEQAEAKRAAWANKITTEYRGTNAEAQKLADISASQGASGTIDVPEGLTGGTYQSDLANFTREYEKTAGKAGNTTKKLGREVNVADAEMRDFSIGLRSAVSMLGHPSLEGSLYFFSQIGRNLKGWPLVLGLTGFALGGIIAGLTSLIDEGAKIDAVSTAFENLSKNIGTVGTELAKQVKGAAGDAITLGESMTQLNRAYMAGGASFANELPRLMEIARSSALATGKDINYVFNSLVTGIARGSPRLIDNADIYLKLGDAAGEYAKQTGKAITQLTAEDKIMATLLAVLKQGEKSIRDIGLSGKTSAEDLQSFSSALKDLKAGAGKILIEIGITKAVGETGDVLSQAADRLALISQFKKDLEMIKLFGEGMQATELSGRAAAAELNALKAYLLDDVEGSQELYQIVLEIMAAAAKFRSELEGQEQTDVGWAEQRTKDTKALAASTDEAAKRMEEFNTAFNDAAEMDTPFKEMAKGLGDLVKNMTAALSGLRIPEMKGGIMEIDTGSLESWLLYTRDIIGVESDAYIAIANLTNQIREQQKAIIANASAYGTNEGKMLSFAQAAFGVDATAKTIIENFDSLTVEAKRFVTEIGTLSFALDEFYAARREPISIKVVYDEVTKAQDALDDLATQISLAGGKSDAEAFRARGVAVITAFEQGLRELGEIDPITFQILLGNALAGITAEGEQLRERYEGIKEIGDQINNLIRDSKLPKLPDIGELTLMVDTYGLNQYITRLQELGLIEASAAASTRSFIFELANERRALMDSAAAIADPAERLRFLITQLFGADAGLQEFADGLKDIPADIRPAVLALGDLSAAIAFLNAQKLAPVTLDVEIGALISGREAIESATEAFTDYMEPTKVLNLRRNTIAAYEADLKALGKRQTTMSVEQYNLEVRALQGKYTTMLNDAQSYYDSLDSRSKESASARTKDAGAIKSAIEAAMKTGLEVTEADMLATKAGTYEDTTMESARRLNAIAERGFSELKAHPDWAAALQIPPDVLGGTEDALKAWAAKTSQDVQDLAADPSMYNWEAFVKNYKEGIDKEAKKEIILDIALGKLKAAGLMEGKTDAEARKEILKMWGLDEPEVTFKTEFPEATTSDKALSAFFKQMRDGEPINSEILVSVKSTEGAGRIVDTEQTPTEKLESSKPLTSTKAIQTGVATGQMAPTAEMIANWNAQLATLSGANPAQVATMLAQPEAEKVSVWREQLNTLISGDNAAKVVTTLLIPSEDNQKSFRDQISSEFINDPITANTALGFRMEQLDEYRGGAEAVFIEQPVTVDTALGGTLESIVLFRDGVENLFKLDPLQIETILVGPDGLPLGPLPEKPEQPGYLSKPEQQASYKPTGKVPGMASLIPEDYAKSLTETIDLTGPGADIASTLYTSIIESVKQQEPGFIIANFYASDFQASKPIWQAIGKSAGEDIATAMVTAIEKNVGVVRKRIAEMIAPEVATILAMSSKGGGALP